MRLLKEIAARYVLSGRGQTCLRNALKLSRVQPFRVGYALAKLVVTVGVDICCLRPILVLWSEMIPSEHPP